VIDASSVAAVATAAALGGGLGLAADRLSTRWPAHEPGVTARGFDWRTLVVAISGAALFAGLVLRWSEPRDLLLLGIFAAALIMLLATDLDQKLLPDLLTLPLIAYAGVLLVLGVSPLLGDLGMPLVSAVAAGIGAPALLFASDRVLHGDLGAGDLKLAAAVGLLAGVSRLFAGFLVASIGFSAVLLGLIAVRRLGLRSAVPFGPVLIGAAGLAMVLP
jgi:leader peptidase (prepilin peptidase) / N-methyltransferase